MGQESNVADFRPNPGLNVQSSLVALISWESDNRPGQPPRYRHLGTGFLATDTGWIISLRHVLAARPENATFSVLALVRENIATELPVIEGPFFPPNAEEITGLCLLKVNRVPPQLNPVEFGYRVEITDEGALHVHNQVFPCDEIGVYATLREDLPSATDRISVVRPYARKGIVSAVSQLNEREDLYFLDVSGFSGYSGGPVFQWDTGGVFAVVTGLEARQQRFEKESGETDIGTYLMHGTRAVRVSECIRELLRRGETIRFVEPVTNERFQYSHKRGRQPLQP